MSVIAASSPVVLADPSPAHAPADPADHDTPAVVGTLPLTAPAAALTVPATPIFLMWMLLLLLLLLLRLLLLKCSPKLRLSVP